MNRIKKKVQEVKNKEIEKELTEFEAKRSQGIKWYTASRRSRKSNQNAK